MLNLKDKRFWKVALTLALPIAMQNLLTSSFTLVDTIMVGQLGDVALSSVGMAGQLSWLLNVFLFGICSGASIFISQFWGVFDTVNIKKTIGLATISACIISSVFLMLGIFVPEKIIRIFNSEPIIISTGVRYLRTVAWSYPAVVLNLVLSAALRAVERVRIPLATALITTVTNIFLDYAMIFGKFGFPEMGIEGAAWATVIAAWTAPVFIAVSAFATKNILYGKPKEYLSFTKSFAVEFYKKATPVIFNEMIWGSAMMVFNIIFANIGYEEYAAFTICKTFENMMFVFFAGLCNSCAIMVGKSVGSGKLDEAKLNARRFMVMTPLLGIVLGFLVIIFREQLVSLFNMSNNISDVTFRTATGILILYAIELPVRNIPYMQICGIFRPGGETVRGFRYDFCGTWLISMPMTLFAAYVLKLPFVFVVAFMYVFDDYPKTIMCLKYFFSDKWIKPVTSEGKEMVENFAEIV
ncbi:MAG: MATE family efflux transporter [Clostridia bacterium]|nr:MATE family efflux transporter [Clostridia bacterium]